MKKSGPIHIGTVVDLHLNSSGVPLLTVMDSSDNIFYPCTMMSSVAGADGRFSISAPALGSAVVLISNTSAQGYNYLIIGGIPHSEDSQAVRVDGIETAIDVDSSAGTNYVAAERSGYFINQDYLETHVMDYHVQNLNSYINLSDVHGMTLRGDPRISFEIDSDATANVFRFAAGGYAGNRVLNAEGFLNKLFTHIEQLQAKIDALENVVNVMSPALINAMTTVGALQNAAAPGSGAAIIAQAEQVTAAQTELSAVTPPRASSTVREDCESDKNPYILIP